MHETGQISKAIMKGSRGTKRSSWTTFKRRLLLVRLLLRGPTSKQRLINQVQAILRDDGYPLYADSALKNDFEALKRDFNCDIKFRRKTASYELNSPGTLILFDITDASFDALIFLEDNEEALPAYTNIRAFLDEVRRLLPPERQEKLQSRSPISLERTGTVGTQITTEIMNSLQQAIRRQEIEFQYRSNHPGGPLGWHRAAPYEIIIRPTGHAYLDATTLEMKPLEPGLKLPSATMYRIDRIVPGTLKTLPKPLPPHRLGVQVHHIKYWLHPNVARRRDVASHFPNSQITYNEDESAIVTATSTNLWQARQILLRYGSACTVLEPIELVNLFKKAIQDMARNYHMDAEGSGTNANVK